MAINWDRVWTAMGTVAGQLVDGALAARTVQELAKYRMDAAHREVDKLTRKIISENNAGLLNAVVYAFTQEIVEAPSEESHEHICKLFWYFKEQLGAGSIEGSGAVAG